MLFTSAEIFQSLSGPSTRIIGLFNDGESHRELISVLIVVHVCALFLSPLVQGAFSIPHSNGQVSITLVFK